MPATETRHAPEELARLGAEAVERRARPTLRPEDHGEFVAVDIGTGDFEIDDDDDTTVARRRARSPSVRGLARPRRGAGGLSDGTVPVIRGVVNARNEGIVSLRVRGPGGSEPDVDAVVDSGSTAPLTPPASINPGGDLGGGHGFGWLVAHAPL